MRVQFLKGQQRKFIDKILELTGSPSLKELSNRMGINYSSLKNYYSESRFLPESLFNDLISLSKFNVKELQFGLIKDTWGQSKGGKISLK